MPERTGTNKNTDTTNWNDDDLVLFSDLTAQKQPPEDSNNNTLDNKDDLVRMSTTAAPTTTTTMLSPHAASTTTATKEQFMDVSLILIWCCVGLAGLYYITTEQQRRRRILRRRRQERLEQFSPTKQAQRKLELLRVLKATTMTITSGKEFVHHHDDDDDENDYKENATDWDSETGESKDNDNGNNNHREGPKESLEASCKKEELESDSHLNTSDEDKDSAETDLKIQHLCHAQPSILDLSSSSSWRSDDILSDDEEGQWTLRLPMTNSSISSSNKDVTTALLVEVPATCIICLKRYQVHDHVTWSPNNNSNQHAHPQPNNTVAPVAFGCPHAFHQECIVEWLAKLPNFNCPVCRAVFCQLPLSKKQRPSKVFVS